MIVAIHEVRPTALQNLLFITDDTMYTYFEFVSKKQMYVATGVAFYTSNCKEVVSPERKLVLFDLKKKEFYDDFSGAENCNQPVRQLLNIPSREIVEV